MANQPKTDFNSETVQRLVDRFARAKWITGLNIVVPDWHRLQFTELGQERMNALAKKLGAGSKEFGKVRRGILAHIWVVFHMAIICRGLVPPPFTEEEIWALGAMACCHGKTIH